MNLKSLPIEHISGILGDAWVISSYQSLPKYNTLQELVEAYCEIYPEEVRQYLKKYVEEE